MWCSLTVITEIKHRVVALRMLRLAGTVASCQRAVGVCHAAATQGRRLTQQQAKAAEEAGARLAKMAV